jgi:beta-glucanase (GH16 family)
MKICDFVSNVLVVACPNVYHDQAFKETDEYIVWTITGKKMLRADGMRDEAAGQYYIDIYTKKEFSEIPARLEQLMDMYDEIAYDDPACSYDIKTGYTHFVYSVEVTV